MLLFHLLLDQPTVIDGATLRVGEARYHLVRIDAPRNSSDARCPLEGQRGDKATSRLKDLIANARKIEALPAGKSKNGFDWPLDKRGQRLVTLEIDGRDVSQVLLDEGLVDYWRPTRPRDWCSEW